MIKCFNRTEEDALGFACICEHLKGLPGGTVKHSEQDDSVACGEVIMQTIEL
jgi:hypothetical protein